MCNIELSELRHSSLERSAGHETEVGCCYGNGVLHVVQDLLLVVHAGQEAIPSSGRSNDRGIQLETICYIIMII